eukprot:TRINITY_DN8087_c0_g1_i2.p1 TRINITY_DN8087_c0_g1~~TRINITY_DN8087_c0_g1_i2.p1  ORF type:complete len:244 (+),score=63.04 TRINITY_DN8087_c0_g1_i2:501-1232(+)
MQTQTGTLHNGPSVALRRGEGVTMPEEEDFGLMVTPPSGQGKPRDVMADLRMVEEEGDDAPPSWDSGDLLVQPATPLDKSPESAATQRGIQKLATLATDLMSPKPIKRHRSVTFEQSCLPPECNVDNVVSATIYHNGQCLELEKTRKKPGQTGYQIFLIKPQGAGGVCETFSIAPDQPYKVVFTHGEGSSFGFTGAEDSKGSRPPTLLWKRVPEAVGNGTVCYLHCGGGGGVTGVCGKKMGYF